MCGDNRSLRKNGALLLLACALYAYARRQRQQQRPNVLKFSMSSLTWVNPCNFAPVAAVHTTQRNARETFIGATPCDSACALIFKCRVKTPLSLPPTRRRLEQRDAPVGDDNITPYSLPRNYYIDEKLPITSP